MEGAQEIEHPLPCLLRGSLIEVRQSPVCIEMAGGRIREYVGADAGPLGRHHPLADLFRRRKRARAGNVNRNRRPVAHVLWNIRQSWLMWAKCEKLA